MVTAYKLEERHTLRTRQEQNEVSDKHIIKPSEMETCHFFQDRRMVICSTVTGMSRL